MGGGGGGLSAFHVFPWAVLTLLLFCLFLLLFLSLFTPCFVVSSSLSSCIGLDWVRWLSSSSSSSSSSCRRWWYLTSPFCALKGLQRSAELDVSRYAALEATNVQQRRQVEQLELLCKEQAEAAQQLSKRQQVRIYTHPSTIDPLIYFKCLHCVIMCVCVFVLTTGPRSARRETQSQNGIQSRFGTFIRCPFCLLKSLWTCKTNFLNKSSPKEHQLNKVIDKNAELTIENCDLTKQVQELRQVSIRFHLFLLLLLLLLSAPIPPFFFCWVLCLFSL